LATSPWDSKTGPELGNRGGKLAAFAARDRHHFDAFKGHQLAQVGLAAAGQALARPFHAEAEFAAAVAAAGDHHAVGAAAQGVFDEGGRQHAGADQAQRCRIGCREGADVGAPVATEDHQPGVAGKPGEARFELPAQRVRPAVAACRCR
jgi:hypothetical protein